MKTKDSLGRALMNIQFLFVGFLAGVIVAALPLPMPPWWLLGGVTIGMAFWMAGFIMDVKEG